MKTFYLTVIFTVFLFICSNGILAQTVQTDAPSKVEYYKVSEVRITISNPSDILELRKQGLGFENMKLNDKSFDVMLDSFQINLLKKTGYSYEIIIDDVTKDYLERTKESREMLKTKKATKSSGFGFGSMGGFYTLSEVVAQLDSMRNKYPSLITAKDSIGTSIEGRTIWAVKISDNPDVKENEPKIFYNSLIHGGEPQGMMAVLYFMFHLLENYGTNSEVTYLVNNRELYFIPVINADGYAFVEQISPDGGVYWRKNRRDLGGGKFGVDLNRNFGYMWGYDDIGSSPVLESDLYRGTVPFSEPETQAVREFCVAHHFLISNSFHTYDDKNPSVWPPWAFIRKQSTDSVIFNRLIKIATSTNGYVNGIFRPLNPFLNGEASDWMYGETSEKNRIFAVATEASNLADGHWPRPERIVPLAAEHVYPNLVYAWGPGIIENPPFISDGKINAIYLNPKTDTLKFNAVERNPDGHSSKVYAQLLYSKDSIVSETMLAQTDSTFNGTLSFNESDENFYKVRYRQSGTDIPSNLYYSDAGTMRFTTAGPVVLDSISFKKSSLSYLIKPFLKKESAVARIKKPTVKIICTDNWALPIKYDIKDLREISAGGIETTGNPFQVKYIDSLFTGYFNFKVEISSDGYVYWTDSVKLIVDSLLADTTSSVIEPLSLLENNLDQNYPNPFNTVTTINWQLAENSKVTLKVLDIVGRTVATLVNEQRPQGKYETRLNAEKLPQGIYFYQLKAGDFIQTRKMILVE